MLCVDPTRVVTIRYTNYRGETALRRIVPTGVRFAATEWHSDQQWILDAFDLDREAERSFAFRGILSWNPDQTAAMAPMCVNGH